MLRVRTQQRLGQDDVRAAETLTITGPAQRDDVIYAGKVDHGFDKSSAADLRKRLKPPIRKTQHYAKRIAHKGIWVEPKLLAEIEHRANRPKEGSGTRSSRVCGRICDGRFRPLLALDGEALGNPKTIPAELHLAAMKLSPEDQWERAKMNGAAARVGRVDG
jgi:hypothetical protein